MSRVLALQGRITQPTDQLLTAALAEEPELRDEWVGHAVQGLAEIGMTALSAAMTADSDAETDALGSAVHWARARGLAEAVEILARHIAPQTKGEPARA